MRTRLRDPLLIQAVIAGALSFAHIHDIAVAAGQGGWKAWAYPFSVDLLLIMAWKQIREAADGESTTAPRVWFFTSLAASMGANISASGVIDLAHPSPALRVLVAGWPVIAFFGGSLLVHGRKAHTDQEADEEPQTARQEPAEAPAEKEAPAPEIAPQMPNLVTYAEAAAVAGVAVETVRGAANGPRARLAKHLTNDGPRVDLDEVRKIYSLRTAGV